MQHMATLLCPIYNGITLWKDQGLRVCTTSEMSQTRERHVTITLPSMSPELIYKDAVDRRIWCPSLPSDWWTIQPALALYPNIHFFLLAEANSRVYTLTTHAPSLKEDARLSVIKLTAWESYTEYSRGVFLSVESTNDSTKWSKLLEPSEDDLEQWFSAFLMLPPFNTGPHMAVIPPTIKLPYCNFITVILLLLWIET